MGVPRQSLAIEPARPSRQTPDPGSAFRTAGVVPASGLRIGIRSSWIRRSWSMWVIFKSWRAWRAGRAQRARGPRLRNVNAAAEPSTLTGTPIADSARFR